MESHSHTDTELREELKQKRKELSALRFQLKSTFEEKEAQYKQLGVIRNSIKSCLTQISSLKGERDQLTNKVKELKQQRDTFNTLTKEKATLKEEANKRKQELSEKLGKFDLKNQKSKGQYATRGQNATSNNPSEMRSLIKKLEHKLETEVMPFPQEEKVRKQVKELQAQLKKRSELSEVWKISNATAADAAEARHKAQQLHQEVQGTAGLSQQKHQQVTSLYDQIKELRKQEAPILEKHLALKNQYELAKLKLQEIQSRVQELGKLFNDTEEKSFKEQIKEKTAQVKEKILKKQKLKIDDILAFQASDEN